MRILFLSRWFPYPANNGSKLRIYNLLRGIATEHRVTLLSFADVDDGVGNIGPLAAVCAEVHTVPWKPYNPQGQRAKAGYFSTKPRYIIDTFSPELKAKIEQILASQHIDLIIASQIDMAAYIDSFQGKPTIFEEIEATVLYEMFTKAASPVDKLRRGLTWIKYRQYLTGLVKRCRICTVVSEEERQLVRRVTGASTYVEVVPNGVNLSEYSDVDATPQPNNLIFTGSFTYYPNFEAMHWFTSKVLPLVQQQVPDTTLTITGNHADYVLPQHQNVALAGFVDDVRPLIAQSWASVVPIHTGGGTRLKILEALALKTPVIATSKGAEGLAVEHNRHVLIADTPEDFAKMVVRILQEPHLRTKLAENGYQLVREKYDWPVIMPRFLELVRKTSTPKESMQVV